MRRNRRVKIVATLGPASASAEMIERLFIAGVDVFRINMSHSTHDGSKALYNTVRACAARHRHPIGILADLQGPKFRVGEFQTGRVQITEKSIFKFDRDETPGSAERVFLPHEQIFAAVKPGHMLVLDDGKLRMRVVEGKKDQIVCEVTVGGMLASRKGISMPDSLLAISPLTEKDRLDLAHALKLGVDWIALSFVQRAEDVHETRQLIGNKAAILSKIEKPSAVADIENIIAASDGIMVARGDLGVEMPVEKVPGLQKMITRMARSAGKPVIVATQMLESMISSPMPTRAEVSDVATAVFDGADAVMLSAESAVGQFPVEAIQTMDRIGIEVEADPLYEPILHATKIKPLPTGADAIAAAASAIAGTVIGIVASAWLWTYTRASAEQIVPQPSIVQAPVAPDPVPASAQDVKGATSATIAGPTQPPPSVQPPATTKINLPTPTNYVGTISIDGEPAGEVFIDRRSAGRTPLRVENLKAGSHLIWIESDGYRRFTRVVLVPSGRVTRLWADLEPLSTR